MAASARQSHETMLRRTSQAPFPSRLAASLASMPQRRAPAMLTPPDGICRRDRSGGGSHILPFRHTSLDVVRGPAPAEVIHE